MTAREVLDQAHNHGVQLFATRDRKLRWRCQGPLPDTLRVRLVEHKYELLRLLWDQEAVPLIEPVRFRRRELFGRIGWPKDDAASMELWPLLDAIDSAWLARDPEALRLSVIEFLAALGADDGFVSSVSVSETPRFPRFQIGFADADTADYGQCETDEEFVRRVFGWELREPHKCSFWCHCHAMK